MRAIKCKTIYTGKTSETISGYLRIKGNIIHDIISDENWNPAMAEEVLDYSDGFLMPAFNDYHVHMALAAMMEYYGTVRTVSSEDAAAAYLYERNKEKIDGQWILGGAWDHFVWPGQKLPGKESLDRYFPHTPVFSLNKECHGAWLNSEALRRFNITKDTPDPPNGSYFKDENGEPTGYVHELAIAPMLAKIFEDITDEQIVEYAKSFAKMANRFGITSVGDLPLYGITREGAYRIIQKEGNLSVRINFSVGMNESNKKIQALRDEFKGPLVSFNGIKEFLDGTPMGYTGYLVEPYSDRPGFVSESMIPKDELFARIIELDKQNVRCRLHCCGDGAVRLALDAFEAAVKTNEFHDIRHAIEHIEIITPSDIPRFSELGVIASMQPEHTPRTHFSTHPFHHLIGEERMEYMWPFKSILDTGAHVAFGTDYPVVEFTPFKGLFRAVNRLTNELEPKGGYNPKEKISVYSALEHYTYGPAYASGKEKELGTIDSGKLADLVVLGKNPADVIHDRDQMFDFPVLMTMMDGNVVYEG